MSRVRKLTHETEVELTSAEKQGDRIGRDLTPLPALISSHLVHFDHHSPLDYWLHFVLDYTVFIFDYNDRGEMFKALLDWLRSLLWNKQADIALIGLQNSGKTSLVNVLAAGEFSQSMIPTVGFNLRKVTKGNVTFKLWDIGGQPRFRSMWERYCRGVNAIAYIVDSADKDSFPAAKAELHALLEKPELQGIPVLVLGNKNDLDNHAKVDELISALELSSIINREVSCYSVSAKSQRNIDLTLNWLLKRA